jgi:hypothetical protein
LNNPPDGAPANEDDARWRAWLRELPSPKHPEPQAAKSYLLSVAQLLENQPGPIEGLTRDVKLLIIQHMALHLDIIAYELDREALLAESRSFGEAAADAAAILGSISPEAKAGSSTLKYLAGTGRKAREVRLQELQKLALGVRKLMLLLQQSILESQL